MSEKEKVVVYERLSKDEVEEMKTLCEIKEPDIWQTRRLNKLARRAAEQLSKRGPGRPRKEDVVNNDKKATADDIKTD